jgi:hypothetical protein
MAYKGFFKPRNPEKYRGDVNNIIYRSRWELKLLMRADIDPNILQYSSEEFFIPYYNPLDDKWHRYFPDMWMKTIDGRNLILEIKPYKQTIPPKKQNKRYLIEMQTFIINKQKWDAALKYCGKKGSGWHFIILTEKELDINF